MTDTPPLTIRLFEGLLIASLVLGLFHRLAIPDYGHIMAVANAALFLVLTLLVSRRRQNWARWFILVAAVIGLATMVWNLNAIAGYPLLTAVVTLLQLVALALVFTKQASTWLRRQPALG